MPAHDRSRPGERGQIIVIFALGLVAMVAMVGLVLDGGSTFAQRRAQQNASDLGALAAANVYLLTNSESQATAAARDAAQDLGFVHGTGGVTVNVGYDLSAGAKAIVDVTAPHRNNFAGVVGMGSWNVSTTATAITGIPDGATNVAPFIFHIDIFGPDGTPDPTYSDPDNPFAFNLDNSDVPTEAGDIAWTDFAYDKPCEEPGNVDANTVKNISEDTVDIHTVIGFGCYIGQHNNGNMTTMYSTINNYMAGDEFSVPVVDDGGNFQGWATFHVVSADGGSEKELTGYFVSPFIGQTLTVGCPDGTCPRYLGTYVLRLID